MNADLEDWKNGWHGLKLAIAPQEIDRLIELLQAIKSDPEEHFHVSSDYKANGGLGDIEVYIKDATQPDNLFLSGVALGPGAEISVGANEK